jgi:hypothetical protein
VVSVELPEWISSRAKLVIEAQSETSIRGVARVGRRRVAELMWMPDGRLLYEMGLDEKGRRDGMEVERHEAGGVAWCAQWVHGKQHGLTMQFDARGRPVLVMEFVRGRGTDIWMGCGVVSEIREMEHGTLHGTVRWGSARRPWCEERFFGGLRHGIFREWEDGALRRGFPRFYVKDERVARSVYLAAQKRDGSLPRYDERDDANERPMPVVVREALARAKALRREVALLAWVKGAARVRREDADVSTGKRNS